MAKKKKGSVLKGLPVLPPVPMAEIDKELECLKGEDRELAFFRIQALERELIRQVRERFDAGVKSFIAAHGLENSLSGQMIVQRLVRLWLEIQALDQLLEECRMTFSSMTETGALIIETRQLLKERITLERQFGAYMEQLGVSPRQVQKYEIERERLDFRKKLAENASLLREKGGSDPNVIDLAQMLTEKG